MRTVIVSDSAQRVIDSFSPEHHSEYVEITNHLLGFFPAMVRRRLLIASSLWSVRDAYRYWDGAFPYVMWLAIDACGADECIFLYVIAPAPIDPPSQARI